MHKIYIGIAYIYIRIGSRRDVVWFANAHKIAPLMYIYNIQTIFKIYIRYTGGIGTTCAQRAIDIDDLNLFSLWRILFIFYIDIN